MEFTPCRLRNFRASYCCAKEVKNHLRQDRKSAAAFKWNPTARVSQSQASTPATWSSTSNQENRKFSRIATARDGGLWTWSTSRFRRVQKTAKLFQLDKKSRKNSFRELVFRVRASLMDFDLLAMFFFIFSLLNVNFVSAFTSRLIWNFRLEAIISTYFDHSIWSSKKRLSAGKYCLNIFSTLNTCERFQIHASRIVM